MWFILLVGLGFLLPVISVKSLRSKLLYFLNALIVTWILIDSSTPFIRQIYFENMAQAKFSQILSLTIFSFLSIFYFIYGIIKLYKRKKEIVKIFKNKTNLDLKLHFSGELNKEERFALFAASPGIIVALFVIVIQLLQFK